MTAIDAHIDWMRERGMSTSTINARRRIITKFQSHRTPNTILIEADVDAWWKTYDDKAPATKQAALAHVRAFLRWAGADDVTAHIHPPKVNRATPRPMSEDDFVTALHTNNLPVRRAVALAGYAGLRAIDIAQLRWSDIDVLRRVIHVRNSKGGKDRDVPMSDALQDIIMADMPDDGRQSRPDSHVVHQRKLKPMSANAVSTMVNRHLRAKGITATLHQLRHRFGTVAYQRTQDIRTTQQLLGHASPLTTAGYAAPNDDMARRAVEALGPREMFHREGYVDRQLGMLLVEQFAFELTEEQHDQSPDTWPALYYQAVYDAGYKAIEPPSTTGAGIVQGARADAMPSLFMVGRVIPRNLT